VADGHPVVGGLDRDAAERVRVAVGGDEAGDEVLLGALEAVRGLVEAQRLGLGQAHIEGSAVRHGYHAIR
jgi:hypothetical protein